MFYIGTILLFFYVRDDLNIINVVLMRIAGKSEATKFFSSRRWSSRRRETVLTRLDR